MRRAERIKRGMRRLAITASIGALLTGLLFFVAGELANRFRQPLATCPNDYRTVRLADSDADTVLFVFRLFCRFDPSYAWQNKYGSGDAHETEYRVAIDDAVLKRMNAPYEALHNFLWVLLAAAGCGGALELMSWLIRGFMRD